MARGSLIKHIADAPDHRATGNDYRDDERTRSSNGLLRFAAGSQERLELEDLAR